MQFKIISARYQQLNKGGKEEDEDEAAREIEQSDVRTSCGGCRKESYDCFASMLVSKKHKES